MLIIVKSTAQPAFEIINLTGTVKIQRPNSRTWEKLKTNDAVKNDDIVETFFKSRLILKYGGNNFIVLGSNSKALLNIDKDESSSLTEMNTTLFSGGIFVKVLENCQASLFTAQGVATIDSGSISGVIEEKTSTTGFQVIGGSAKVRNISKQNFIQLNSGQTTIIRPQKNPTIPVYITFKHVSVLQHFFGKSYIDNEIKAADISPTKASDGVNRIGISQNMLQDRGVIDRQIYKKIFSLNKIYGSLLDDQVKNAISYRDITPPERVHSNMGTAGLNSFIAFANQQVYPAFRLYSSFYFNNFSIGINIPLSKTSKGNFSMLFNKASGFFDKIDHITAGSKKDSTYISLCEISDLTFGKGLIVDNYRSRNPYSAVRPLGILGTYKKDDLCASGFISDISSFRNGGIYLSAFPGAYFFGAGYYYDGNQLSPSFDKEHLRFIDMPRDADSSNKSNTHIYELNMGIDMLNNVDIRSGFFFQFAQKIISAHTEGNLFTFPGFYVKYKKLSSDISLYVENGRIIHSHFNSFYSTNRRRIINNFQDTVSYIVTQNNYLSKNRQSFGIDLDFKISPVKGSNITFEYTQDFVSNNVFAEGVDSTDKNNYSYSLSFTVNDSLINAIKYGNIFVRQIHGGYYPSVARFFGSWGFEAGVKIITNPLFLNIALKTGFNFTYLDLDIDKQTEDKFNNNIDADDLLPELYVGLIWGFL